MDPPTRKFASTLIPQSEKISWTIHNVLELCRSNAWTALTIPMEVGLGPTELSKWEISLHSNGKILQARARLLTPDNRRVTHHLTFWLVRHGRPSHIRIRGEEFSKAKECSVPWPPSYWKIIPLEDLMDEESGLVTPEDTMEIIIQLTVFGADVSEPSE